MPLRGAKKPLYRRVNTRTFNVKHGHKSTSVSGSIRQSEGGEMPKIQSMHSKHKHGLDYTPLYKFLLKSVGKNWDEVFSEVVPRLDKQEPIFFMVARAELDQRRFFRSDENSYFSGLFVDAAGLLQKVDPELTAGDMVPYCACCAHSFNGEPFGKEFGEAAPVFE